VLEGAAAFTVTVPGAGCWRGIRGVAMAAEAPRSMREKRAAIVLLCDLENLVQGVRYMPTAVKLRFHEAGCRYLQTTGALFICPRDPFYLQR
jgi:hypothetical protein